MKYNALIDDLVSLAEESHDFQESIVCTEASTTIRHLFNENERFAAKLKHMEEAAVNNKPATFSLQDFIRANMVPPKQQVGLCERVDGGFAQTVWRGPFSELPQSYAQRDVDKVFAWVYDAALECYRYTLYILLAPES
jgi:hypothetical protein